MDKETLSNYGWIVICVLVLAVMIALAGPFGTFVAGAVKSTTAGLFGVNQNALGAAGITIDDQAFANGPSITFNQELSTDSNTPTEVTGTSFTLSGTVSSEKGIKSLTVNGTEVTVQADGTWTTTLTLTKNEVKEVIVAVMDNEDNAITKTGYVGYIVFTEESIDKSTIGIGYSESTSILNVPSKYKKGTGWYKAIYVGPQGFLGCTNLTEVTLPNTIVSIGQMGFTNCTELTKITLPESITNISMGAFAGCTKLTTVIFNGTMAQWNAVTLGTNWINLAPATEVICSDGRVSLS